MPQSWPLGPGAAEPCRWGAAEPARVLGCVCRGWEPESQSWGAAQLLATSAERQTEQKSNRAKEAGLYGVSQFLTSIKWSSSRPICTFSVLLWFGFFFLVPII